MDGSKKTLAFARRWAVYNSGEKLSHTWSVSGLLRDSFKRARFPAAHSAGIIPRSEDSNPTPESRPVSHPRPSRPLGDLRPYGLLLFFVILVGAARVRKEQPDHNPEKEVSRASAPQVVQQPQGGSDSVVSIKPSTQKDLVIFAGPSLGSIDTVEPAPWIYLDRSFRQDRTIAHDFTLLARDVERIVRGMFDGASPPVNKPIVCWIGSPLPLTDSTSDRRFIWIRIALTDQDLKERNYCRFAYQLSHEMGHLYLEPRRSNGLIETLADCITYKTLARLSQLWESEFGNREDIKSYASRFLIYRDMKTAEKMKCLPPEVLEQIRLGRTAEVRSYLEHHTQQLDKTPYTETGLALRAMAAMIFPQEANWKPFVGIAGLTDPSPSLDGRYREGLPTEIDRAPEEVRELLSMIGRQ